MPPSSSHFFPHSQLFIRPSFTIVISGPHIQVVDSRTGLVVNATTKFERSQRDCVLNSGHVRCAAIDPSHTYLATTGDDKTLKVWDVGQLKLLSDRELPKRPTHIQFTANGQTILVSDKFGDVFSYPVHSTAPSPEPPAKDPLASHENPWGTLVLGHVSLLTTFLLTSDENYIITADRDEHIRVSWYPQGYCIERYCLGHKKFVSTIHIPEFARDTLISAGGDPMIKIWDWMAGTVKHEVRIREAVEPFIRVRPPPRRRRPDDDDDGDAVEASQQRQTISHRRKRNRQQTRAQEGCDDEPDEAVAEPTRKHGESRGEETEEPNKAVLVVHKIATLDTPNRCIVFSGVGVSALFSCFFPDSSGGQDVRFFDFEKPVIDFEIAPDGSIWVSLDAYWSEGPDQDRPAKLIRVVSWTGTEFVETSSDSALLAALNSTCVLQGSEKDLASLDLYGPLSALPKSNWSDPDAVPSIHHRRDAKEAKEPSKRALGRMKAKQLLAKAAAGGPRQPPQDEETGSGKSEKRVRSEHDEADAMDVP